MASAGEKSLAVGHIPGFQIDPNSEGWKNLRPHDMILFYHPRRMYKYR